jgi:hypothetical protein
LTIAQRFNARFANEVKIESREGRKKVSIVPMGLNKEERIVPSVKTPGYFQFGPEYYEMAKPSLPARPWLEAPENLILKLRFCGSLQAAKKKAHLYSTRKHSGPGHLQFLSPSRRTFVQRLMLGVELHHKRIAQKLRNDFPVIYASNRTGWD